MMIANLAEEIRDLLGASENQAQEFSRLVRKLESLKIFSDEFSEDFKPYQCLLARASKALNYKNPYKISVIGTSGAGKSTLINAMLGRNLVLMKDIGKPATGTALKIFQDVQSGGSEIATVSYRDEADIRSLVDEFVSRYGVQELNLNGQVDLDLAKSLSQLKPLSNLKSDRDRNEFQALARSLSDLVKQFLSSQSHTVLEKEFPLHNGKANEELNALIDENSLINQRDSSGRQIGLVKSVTYRIKPDDSTSQLNTLKLPKNVCLVDLPGLDGTALHDIIISQGVEEADAVIFILRPPRILGQSDVYLIEKVRRHLGLSNSIGSSERVFIVLNAKDQIMQDDKSVPQNLPRDMEELVDSLSSAHVIKSSVTQGNKKTPYFMTSAWAAYMAQRRIKGEISSNDETYAATKIKLGVNDGNDLDVLEASQVPKLVNNITEFAREHRIDGQLREGKLVLEAIVNQLRDNYQLRKSQLTEDRGEYYFREKLYKQLEEQKDKLQKEIIQLRQEVLKIEQFHQQKTLLEEQVKRICDSVDQQLLSKMPAFWKEHYREGIDRLMLETRGATLYEPLLTEVQIFIWKQLNGLFVSLGDTLIKNYRNHLETYNLSQRITEGAYGFIEASEIDSILEEELSKMQKTFSNVSNRIAVVRMADPDTYFTRSDEKNQPTKMEIVRIIKALPNTQELSAKDFEELIKAIRKDYEDFAVSFSVRGLLNLYRYELILVEDKLCFKIREVFESMRNKDETILRAKVQGEDAEAEWKELTDLENKLEKLKSIEHQA